MDEEYKKEAFKSLSIKRSVVLKFRQYCKNISKSQSMTLLLMLDFFEINNLSPTEILGPKMHTLESAINKRINALIAIVRDIEKSQTLPTKAMLDALFEELPAQTKKKFTPSFEKAFRNSEINAADLPKIPTEPDHKDIRSILNRVELVKPRFGQPYYRLSLETEQLENLKTKYHVYHN